MLTFEGLRPSRPADTGKCIRPAPPLLGLTVCPLHTGLSGLQQIQGLEGCRVGSAAGGTRLNHLTQAKVLSAHSLIVYPASACILPMTGSSPPLSHPQIS